MRKEGREGEKREREKRKKSISQSCYQDSVG
jgi:hypothetical protein